MHACDWNNLEPLNQAIIEGVRAGKRVCKTLAFTAITPEPYDHLLCAEIFGKHYFPAQQPLWSGEIYHHSKIRIAYVSPDLREHPVGHLTAGIFEHHDKNKFETIAISLGIDDNSRLRARMLEAFDEFIDARQMTSFDIAKLLRSKEVDILVDLAGYTADSRTEIFAYRPAPIQVNYLGYSSTLGIEYMDYIIADRHIIPEKARDSYSEKVVYLPDTYLPTDSAVKISDTTLAREEYGLPATGFVFCSFNHDYKINSPMFDIWMRLLKCVPGSVLWLMKLNESAERNLRKEAAARDIDPSRIIFATRVPNIEDHLARYRAADLFLDTFPCNAHTTSSDVLRAGLPLITCRGKAFAGRVASGLLTLVGLPELITETLEDYEKLALQLATQNNMLQKIKAKLGKNLKNDNPFDTQLYCFNLEQAFIKMHQRYLNNEAPDHLTIQAAEIKTTLKTKI
jgi:predicted O-linked N-acetylglucosamine transferase (SPINDLY family)